VEKTLRQPYADPHPRTISRPWADRVKPARRSSSGAATIHELPA